MTLPRDLSGDDLARLLHRHYGYRLVRQKGSHMTLSVSICGEEHSIGIPLHRAVKVGTLGSILSDVADHLSLTRNEVRRVLFGR